MNDDTTLRVTKVIDATLAEVWKAWTDQTAVAAWWAPEGSKMTIEEMDVRAGGTFRFSLEMANGYTMPNVITYDEVSEPTLLAYTYDPGKASGLEPIKSVFSFKDIEGKTEITLQLRWATAAEKEKHVSQYGAVEGAKQTLIRLGDYLGGKLN